MDAAKLTLCSAGCDGAAMGYFPACSLCEIVESLSDLTQFKVPGLEYRRRVQSSTSNSEP